MKKFYWDSASEYIWKILKKNFNTNMNICELGCGSGHFLQKMYKSGYTHLTGIDIREEQLKETQRNFLDYNIKAQLICLDILNLNKKFDAFFSTGLLQCLQPDLRDKVIQHVCTLSPLSVFVVPEILKKRNEDSSEKIGVSGCVEFPTGNLEWEISKYYKKVKSGKIEKTKIKLNDNFLYFICEQ